MLHYIHEMTEKMIDPTTGKKSRHLQNIIPWISAEAWDVNLASLCAALSMPLDA